MLAPAFALRYAYTRSKRSENDMTQTAVKAQKAPVELGWEAQDFALPGTDGKTYSIKDLRGPQGLLVIFMCNHCPYVLTALDRIIRDVTELHGFGIGAVGINANDPASSPDDSFENMKRLAAEQNLPFPYLFDETQAIAHAYDAATTPEFYGFDAQLKLAYQGRLDDAGRLVPQPTSKREMFEAMKTVAETGRGPLEQQPAIGCSIKWKATP